jgi:hypothetical protein
MVVVALAFQPLRRRLRRMADRVVYGRRADPYEALARFGRSLGACQVFCVNGLLILLVGRGSSVFDGVPVLAAVKRGPPSRAGRWVDRGCAPARAGWSAGTPGV